MLEPHFSVREPFATIGPVEAAVLFHFFPRSSRASGSRSRSKPRHRGVHDPVLRPVRHGHFVGARCHLPALQPRRHDLAFIARHDLRGADQRRRDLAARRARRRSRKSGDVRVPLQPILARTSHVQRHAAHGECEGKRADQFSMVHAL